MKLRSFVVKTTWIKCILTFELLHELKKEVLSDFEADFELIGVILYSQTEHLTNYRFQSFDAF